MENFKKSEDIPISLEGDLNFYNRLAQISPDTFSFYLSVGISTLESLILQNYSTVAENCWNRLKTLNSMLNNEDKFLVYFQLIEIMSSPEYDAETKLCWLNEYMQNNQNNAAEALAVSMEEIFNCYRMQLSLNEDNSGNVGISEARILLKKFAEDIGLYIIIVYDESKELFYSDDFEVAPIISLFYSNLSWGIIYHQNWDVSEINTNHFPFLYFRENKTLTNISPNKHAILDEISDEDSSESDTKIQSLNDIVSLLSEIYSQVLIPKATLEKIKNWLQNISEEIDIYELNNFEKALNEQKDNDFIYIKCNHSNESKKKYNCGKLHCSICLKSYVLLQNSLKYPQLKCMCGIDLPLDEILKNKGKACEVCKLMKAKKQFKKVACFSHKICLSCRVKSLREGNGSCPLADREYSNDELKFLNSLSRDVSNYPLKL